MYKTECVVSIECNCGFKYVFLKWFNFHILIAVMNVAHTFCVRLVFRFQYCFKENLKKNDIHNSYLSCCAERDNLQENVFDCMCSFVFLGNFLARLWETVAAKTFQHVLAIVL